MIWFVTHLTNHIQSKGLGRIVVAPFDVELAPDVVVQPDVLVVLNANLEGIISSRIAAPPDLVNRNRSAKYSGIRSPRKAGCLRPRRSAGVLGCRSGYTHNRGDDAGAGSLSRRRRVPEPGAVAVEGGAGLPRAGRAILCLSIPG